MGSGGLRASGGGSWRAIESSTCCSPLTPPHPSSTPPPLPHPSFFSLLTHFPSAQKNGAAFAQKDGGQNVEGSSCHNSAGESPPPPPQPEEQEKIRRHVRSDRYFGALHSFLQQYLPLSLSLSLHLGACRVFTMYGCVCVSVYLMFVNDFVVALSDRFALPCYRSLCCCAQNCPEFGLLQMYACML